MHSNPVVLEAAGQRHEERHQGDHRRAVDQQQQDQDQRDGHQQEGGVEALEDLDRVRNDPAYSGHV